MCRGPCVAHRITNLYTMTRLLYYHAVKKTERKPVFLKRLTWWILICEQWPTRTSMILQVSTISLVSTRAVSGVIEAESDVVNLQVLDDESQLHPDSAPIAPETPLLQFYRQCV